MYVYKYHIMYIFYILTHKFQLFEIKKQIIFIVRIQTV